MYSASAILLKGETPDHCIARKLAACEVAERLASKASVPSLAGYWRDVGEGLQRDIVRLQEIDNGH